MAKLKDPSSVPLHKATKVPVGWLKLDTHNPRLSESLNSDEHIIRQLYKSEDLRELFQSIATNGYLDVEPLVVVLQGNHLVVLEGNRRLAAIKLFLDPSLASRITDVRIALPEISPEKLETLREVSVYRSKDREEARPFIAFKHINGPAKWESFAKARFAASWYKDGGVTIQDISDRIGDNHATVQRMVAGVYVLEQAEKEGLFSVSDRNTARFSFSHFYTAISRRPYMDFLGLTPAWDRSGQGLQPDPVPQERLPELKKVLRWLYGSKQDDVLPVIRSQNPDIKNLGEVLASKEGLLVLEATASLDEAYESIQPVDTKLANALVRARSALREAVGSLRGFEGRERSLLDIAADIKESAETLHERMQKKFQSAPSSGA